MGSEMCIRDSSADLVLAGRAAPVVGKRVAVVAVFTCFNYSVTANRFEIANRVTAIARSRIAVITLLGWGELGLDRGSDCVAFQVKLTSSLACWMPSPQTSFWQVELQPSSEDVLPSSHSSPDSTLPLPQTASRLQLESQPSPDRVLPSSHLSLIHI